MLDRIKMAVVPLLVGVQKAGVQTFFEARVASLLSITNDYSYT